MIEEIPLWLAIPLIVILNITALYKCYILPGYKKDKRKARK